MQSSASRNFINRFNISHEFIVFIFFLFLTLTGFICGTRIWTVIDVSHAFYKLSLQNNAIDLILIIMIYSQLVYITKKQYIYMKKKIKLVKK